MLKNITKIKKFYLTPRISSSIMMKDLIKTLKQANSELAERVKKSEQESAEWFERFEKRKLELKRKQNERPTRI